jgi:hypothetical protein
MRFGKVMALPVVEVLAVAAAGCGSSSNTSSSSTTTSSAPSAPTAAKTAQPMFVGTVTGTNAYIGVIASPAQLIAYVCDGAGNKIGDHFQGNVPKGVTSVTLNSPDSGDTLAVNAGPSQLHNLIATGAR